MTTYLLTGGHGFRMVADRAPLARGGVSVPQRRKIGDDCGRTTREDQID